MISVKNRPVSNIPSGDISTKKPTTAGYPLRFDPLRFAKRVVSPERLNAMIAQAAYLRAANRDFAPGHELEDWLSAEAEISQRVVASSRIGTTD